MRFWWLNQWWVLTMSMDFPLHVHWLSTRWWCLSLLLSFKDILVSESWSVYVWAFVGIDAQWMDTVSPFFSLVLPPVGHTLIKWSHYGTALLNSCWERRDTLQPLMYGAVGEYDSKFFYSFKLNWFPLFTYVLLHFIIFLIVKVLWTHVDTNVLMGESNFHSDGVSCLRVVWPKIYITVFYFILFFYCDSDLLQYLKK